MLDDTLIEHALSTKDSVCYIRTLLPLDLGHDNEIKNWYKSKTKYDLTKLQPIGYPKTHVNRISLLCTLEDYILKHFVHLRIFGN